jgi:hypothetical protein
MLKEELRNALCCDTLLVGWKNCHHRKKITNHKNIILNMIG